MISYSFLSFLSFCIPVLITMNDLSCQDITFLVTLAFVDVPFVGEHHHLCSGPDSSIPRDLLMMHM